MMNLFDFPNIIRKIVHPLLLKAVQGRINSPIKILNSMPKVKGNKLFAINHIAINEDAEMSKAQIIEDLKEKCRSLEKFAQPTRYEVEKVIARTNAGKKDYGYYKKKSGL